MNSGYQAECCMITFGYMCMVNLSSVSERANETVCWNEYQSLG
jgi:hypothetical protein